MKRVFSKVERYVWKDQEFRELSRDARDLWIYLLTCPHTHGMPGLLYLPLSTIINDLAFERYYQGECYNNANKALDELIALGWVAYDRTSCVMFVKRAVAHNLPENPNVIKSWLKQLREIPRSRCKLFPQWVESVIATFVALEDGAAENSWRLACFRKMLDSLRKEDITSAKPLTVDPVLLAKLLDFSDISDDELYDEGYLERPTGKSPPPPNAQTVPSSSVQPPLQLLADTPPPKDTGSGKKKAKAKKTLSKDELHEKYGNKVHRLCHYFIQRQVEEKPDMKVPTLEAAQGWYHHMHLLLDVDKREYEAVEELIEWVTQDDFEKCNVRCPRKLRERYDQLEMRMNVDLDKRERRARGGNGAGPKYLEPYVGTYEASQAGN